VQSTFNSDVVDTTFGRLCETGGTAACTFLPRSTLYPLGGSPIGGNDLPRTPRSKFSAGAEYLMPLSAGISLTLRGDLNYQSKYYVENLNLAYIPNRTLVNLDATFSSEDRKWSASLWAKNATDKTYVSSAFAVSVINQYIPAIADGRTMGMTLRYSF
jgi:iron complex outermembrane receptor protein